MCGARVRVDGFRCRGAYREYFASGLCQDCQDRALLGAGEPVRRGLVVGAQASTGAVAALPFVFTAPGRPVAWEARHCVIVAPEGAPCDPWGDLEPLADLLAEHQICVHEADTGSDPGVVESLGAPAVVIGPDEGVLAGCATTLALSGNGQRVALGDAVAWTELFGFPLNPLHRFALRAGFTTGREPDASALRRCAWTAAALALPLPEADHDETVLDAVLGAFPSSPTESIP